jgi:multidrug efflux pump subunit AcrA (membrane-fusion protein)
MSASKILLIAGLVSISMPGCGSRVPTPQSAPAAVEFVTLDDQAQRQAGLRIEVAHTVMLESRTEAPGVLALDESRTARIGSLVEGILLNTFAGVGDRVRAGQVLAIMHGPVVHDAWASYRKAVAERRHLEKELAFAVAAHERARRLLAEKAISLQDVQRADADRVAAEEALDMARTEVRRSEEELEHLGITNADDPTGESGEQIPVKAPIAGVVLERLVTPGTAVTPGTPLYIVSDLSKLWALVEIDESWLSRVQVGQSMQVRVAAYSNETFAGTVSLIGDTINPRTRRITIRCALDNPAGRLKPQMYATAVISDRPSRRAIVVPADAVQTIEGRPTVFIAEPQGRFRARVVEAAPADRGLVEVTSGLRDGERVVVEGAFVLKSELLKSATAEE